MKYSGNRDIHNLVKKLLQNGWIYKRGRKHGRVILPGHGLFVTIPGSPSDCRSYENFRAEVRKVEKCSLVKTSSMTVTCSCMS